MDSATEKRIIELRLRTALPKLKVVSYEVLANSLFKARFKLHSIKKQNEGRSGNYYNEHGGLNHAWLMETFELTTERFGLEKRPFVKMLHALEREGFLILDADRTKAVQIGPALNWIKTDREQASRIVSKIGKTPVGFESLMAAFIMPNRLNVETSTPFEISRYTLSEISQFYGAPITERAARTLLQNVVKEGYMTVSKEAGKPTQYTATEKLADLMPTRRVKKEKTKNVKEETVGVVSQKVLDVAVNTTVEEKAMYTNPAINLIKALKTIGVPFTSYEKMTFADQKDLLDRFECDTV